MSSITNILCQPRLVLLQVPGFWQPQWADALVQYHREYCFYEQCNDLTSPSFQLNNYSDPLEGGTYGFDAALASRGSFAEIIDALNITGASPTFANNFSVIQNQLIALDPLFNTNPVPQSLNNFSNDLESVFTDYLNSYITFLDNETATAITTEITGTANFPISGNNQFSAAAYAYYFATNPNGIPEIQQFLDGMMALGDEYADIDYRAWRIYWGIYMEMKQRRINECTSCTELIDDDYAIYSSNSFNVFGDISTGLSDELVAYETQVNSFCDENLDAQLYAWEELINEAIKSTDPTLLSIVLDQNTSPGTFYEPLFDALIYHYNNLCKGMNIDDPDNANSLGNGFNDPYFVAIDYFRNPDINEGYGTDLSINHSTLLSKIQAIIATTGVGPEQDINT